MTEILTPFAVGYSPDCCEVEVLSGRNGSRLVFPAEDRELLIAALHGCDPQSSAPEKPCLDLSE